MQKRTLLAAAWLAFSLKTAAQATPCTALPQATETMHVNRLRMPHLRPGAHIGSYPNYTETTISADYNGLPQPTAGFSAASFWVGGLDETGQARASAIDYYPTQFSNFHFVAGPFGLSASECGRWDRFWSVGRTALAAHRTDVADGNLDEPLPEILAWPGRGNPHFTAQNGFDLPNAMDDFAPFFDADDNGIYDPFAGDFPHPNGVDTALVPGKIVWNLFSEQVVDTIPIHYLSGMDGFEYQWTAWATACADTSDVLNDAVFFSLRLTNRSGERRDSVVLGLWSDFEIGNRLNDLFGIKIELNTMFGYNGWRNDSIGKEPLPLGATVFKTNPPAVAWTFLNHPLFKTMYYDPGSWICDPPVSVLGPSGTAESFYNFLNAHWSDGTPLVGYGNGYPWNDPTAQPVDFVFDGNPIDSAGWFATQYNPYCPHSKQLASIHLGDLPPNTSKTIDYAFSYHRGPGLDHLQNVGYLFQRVADLRQRYAQNFADDCAPEPLCQADDCVWPGDANRDGIVNHCDILPIGVSIGKTGQPRPGFTTWEGKTAPDWGQLFNQTYDLKHTDANGDGSVGLPDAGVVRDFYGLKKPDYQAVGDEYPIGNELFIPLSSSVNQNNIPPGKVVVVSVKMAAQLGLRGVAYTIEFDTLYWKNGMGSWPKSEYIIDSAQILFRHFQVGNANFGYAKLGGDIIPDPLGSSPNFPIVLLSRTIPPGTPPLTYIRLKNIKGIRADGSEIPLGSWPRQFCFGGGCALGTDEGIESQAVRVFPNPASHAIHVETDGAPVLWLALLDAAGRTLRAPFLEENSPAAICPTDGLPSGLYFLKVKTPDGLAVRKVVVE